jgi:hypothetical protein
MSPRFDNTVLLLTTGWSLYVFVVPSEAERPQGWMEDGLIPLRYLVVIGWTAHQINLLCSYINQLLWHQPTQLFTITNCAPRLDFDLPLSSQERRMRNLST